MSRSITSPSIWWNIGVWVRVTVAAIDAAGADDADRRRPGGPRTAARRSRRWRGASPAPGSGWCGCAAACRSPSAAGFRKKVSCISRAGWRGGKLSAEKLWKSSSMSGPSATPKPISAKMATISSITCMVGCTEPLRRGGAGSERSSRPAASSASSAASSSSALRAATAAAMRSRRPLIAGPSTRRCVRAHLRPGSSAAPRRRRSCRARRRASGPAPPGRRRRRSARRGRVRVRSGRSCRRSLNPDNTETWTPASVSVVIPATREHSPACRGRARRGHSPAPACMDRRRLTAGDDRVCVVSVVNFMHLALTMVSKKPSGGPPEGFCESADANPAQASAARTFSAMALNAAGSDPAMSASTLRSISIPASSRP